MAQKQEVYLSKSKSGKAGFFSGNFMASPLTDAEYEDFIKNPEKARIKAQREGFTLTNKSVKESMNKAQKVGWYVTDIKDKDVFGPGTEQAARAKCKALGGDEKGFNVSYVSDYSAKRQLEKESVETSQHNLLQELLKQLDEFETPGLKLGALKLDTQDNCIYVTIGDQKYKYTPNVADKAGEIYSSVTGMAKHSTGKALAFLKKNATGEKLNEELKPEELEERVFPETHYTWFEVTAPMVNLERRGKIEHIAKGEQIGLRRATSSEGKYRVVTKKMGPSIIFFLEYAEFDQLMKKMKKLKGSL